jgi:transposase
VLMPLDPGFCGPLGGKARHRGGVGIRYRHHNAERQVGLGNDRIGGVGVRVSVFHAVNMASVSTERHAQGFEVLPRRWVVERTFG